MGIDFGLILAVYYSHTGHVDKIMEVTLKGKQVK